MSATEPATREKTERPARDASSKIWLVPLLLPPLLVGFPALAGQILVYRDLFHFNVPQQVFAAAHRAQGTIPTWDPTRYGGTPFLADPGTAFFYPGNFLFNLLDPWTAGTVFVLLHLALAGAGCWVLARKLGIDGPAAALGSLAYATSGYLLSMHGGHYYLSGPALLPWVVAALVHAASDVGPRGVGLGALAVGLLAFNGEFQTVGIAAVLGLALASVPGEQPAPGLAGRLGRATAALALGAAIAAPQLAPTLLFSRATLRGHGLDLVDAAVWSLEPLRLVEFLLPSPFGHPSTGEGWWGPISLNNTNWTLSLFVGPLLLLPAVGAAWWRSRRVAVLAAIGGVSLLAALGSHLPVYGLLLKVVPLFDRFRYPEKYAAVVTLAICLVGAAAWAPLSLARRRASGIFGATAGVLALAAMVAAARPAWLVAAIEGGLSHGYSFVPAAEACGRFAASIATVAGACLAVVGALWATRSRPSMLLPLLLAVESGLALAHGSRLLVYGDRPPAQPPGYVDPWKRLPSESTGRIFNDQSCQDLREEGGRRTEPERRQWEWATGMENLPTLFGLREAFAYGATETMRQVKVLAAVRKKSPELAMRRLGAAGTLTCVSGKPELIGFPDPLPRVRVVRGRAVGEAEMMALLEDREWNPLSEALVAEAVPSDGSGKATVVTDGEDRVVVRTSGGGGLLVLADSWSLGWSATVDGKPARLRAADGLYRSVAVEAGTHEVEFRYEAPGLRWGLAVGIAAMIVIVALLLAPALGRRLARNRVEHGGAPAAS